MISSSQEMPLASLDGSSFQGLIYNVFQSRSLVAASGGLTIALVAAHPRAGTTYVTSRLAETLNRGTHGSAASLDCRKIANAEQHCSVALTVPPAAAQTHLPDSIRMLPPGNWRASRDYREQCLAAIRSRFGYVLLDCPSLKESSDVLGLLTLVDGIVLVIEANRTSKNQIAHLERTIEAAEGKILGHVLNKRTYPIPDWVHQQLLTRGF